MMTVLPHVSQGASLGLAQSALPHAATDFTPDRATLSALVSRVLHRR